MKKYLYLVILLVTISCESIFHDDYNDYVVLDNDREKIDMLNGIYAKMVQIYNNRYFDLMSRSDDINYYMNYLFNWPDFQSGCGETEGFVPQHENIYINLCRIILNVNSILPQLSEKDEPGLVGECYMLRAYAYFTLARFFGNPYLVKDIDVNFTLERPGYKDVYEFIEEDMLNALRLLPETYTDARIPGETPHKGTAKALLAEIYLSWAGYPVNGISKYKKAAQYAGEVIQDAGYYGFGLLDDFADLWKVESKHNKEYVFGLFYNSKDYEIKNGINPVNISSWLDEDQQTHLFGTYKPELKFFKTFPDNYRKNSSFLTGRYFLIPVWTPDSIIWQYEYFTFDPQVAPCRYLTNVLIMKWIDTIEIKNYNGPEYWGPWRSTVTLYLLRYAQTLLTFAEARARSGILDDSTYEAVNMIRRRANHLDPYTPSDFDLPGNLSSGQFLDSVVWERAWELCAEPNGRWFDIVRLDLKDKLPGYRYDFDFPYKVPEEYLQDNWYFYKIPD